MRDPKLYDSTKPLSLYSGQISTVCCGWVSWETNLPSVVVVDAWCIELSSRSLVIRHMYWRAVEGKYRDSTRSLRVLCCISIRLSYANLIGIREMSERANDQLADLIGSECNGHMQAGIASVTPDLRHIRLSPEDWPLRIFCFPPPAPIPCFVRTLIYSWICALP